MAQSLREDAGDERREEVRDRAAEEYAQTCSRVQEADVKVDLTGLGVSHWADIVKQISSQMAALMVRYQPQYVIIPITIDKQD